MRCAVALLLCMTVVAAGAWVHGPDQHDVGGVSYCVCGPGDGYLSGLQGLSQRLQCVAVKLREFIQEQHPMVRETQFPRSGECASADHARLAYSMVWRAKRPGCYKGMALVNEAADAVDLRGL